tara:strand:- start:404 stop:1390 length:987 start_codon:yes stop_codon:yes gene_type:complete
LYRCAALAGDATGQVYTGMMFEKGSGVSQDKDEAIRWYHAAAQQGDSLGQIQLKKIQERNSEVQATAYKPNSFTPTHTTTYPDEAEWEVPTDLTLNGNENEKIKLKEAEKHLENTKTEIDDSWDPAKPLEFFSTAADILDYSESAQVTWIAIQFLPVHFIKEFLSKLDASPASNPIFLALEVYQNFEKDRPPVATGEAKIAKIDARNISLEAEDEFARIYNYGNPTISLDAITKRITIKFGKQDDNRAEAFTYFEKLKSEDEAEREFSEKAIISHELLEKEKLNERRYKEAARAEKPFRMTLSEPEKREQERLERSSKFVFPFFAKKR